KSISKKIIFLTMYCTIKALSALDVHLVPELLKKEKISEQADGGGKTIAKKNAVCMCTNNS
ncbi:MAG: hypothetical protein Q4G11_06245, partial [Gallicola sp.]|nr:hypothetical protein [Gallicola sp.]